MATRREARARALALLFEADVRGREVLEVLAAHQQEEDPPPEFTLDLVSGVARERSALDARISAHSAEWRLSRMPAVDRNLLRLGAWELLHTEVPTAVAIDEAVRMAKELSTDDSGRFVNGILARIAETRPAG